MDRSKSKISKTLIYSLKGSEQIRWKVIYDIEITWKVIYFGLCLVDQSTTCRKGVDHSTSSVIAVDQTPTKNRSQYNFQNISKSNLDNRSNYGKPVHLSKEQRPM